MLRDCVQPISVAFATSLTVKVEMGITSSSTHMCMSVGAFVRDLVYIEENI